MRLLLLTGLLGVVHCLMAPTAQKPSALKLAIYLTEEVCRHQSDCLKDLPLLTIHGLWADDSNGKLIDCRQTTVDRKPKKAINNPPKLPDLPSDVFPLIKEHWPDLKSETYPWQFFMHEHGKHGACIERFHDPGTYFKTAVNFFKNYALQSVFTSLRGQTTTPDKVAQALHLSVDSLQFLCERSRRTKTTKTTKTETSETSKTFLKEVRICLDLNGHAKACGPGDESTTLCGKQFIIYAAPSDTKAVLKDESTHHAVLSFIYANYTADRAEICPKGDCEENRRRRPLKMTIQKERLGHVCFSSEPVEACPMGSVVVKSEKRTVRFACLQNTKELALRLKKNIRRWRLITMNDVEKLEKEAVKWFVEEATMPSVCEFI
ncbi:hypothetical protein QR680_004218 [Steinernema hermaphroditum]|uniref:Uncharacterized protein n=1 Tax=Steinernema hermaphroditum TaxID=289476 RepID=A0AA39HMZ5_9BILA|nr:hypothetical protein QR680_004218 [Steinernema hermaphroditum]